MDFKHRNKVITSAIGIPLPKCTAWLNPDFKRFLEDNKAFDKFVEAVILDEGNRMCSTDFIIDGFCDSFALYRSKDPVYWAELNAGATFTDISEMFFLV